MDDLARAVVDLVSPLVRDLVSAEVRRVVDTMESVDHGERLYTVRSSARRVEMGESTLRRHIAEGRLKVVQVPGRVPGVTEQRVRGADLDDFVLQLAGADSAPKRRRRVAAQGRKRGQSSSPTRFEDLVSERLAASR